MAASPSLVLLDVDPGPAFVDALRAVWEAGDAAAPLDRRLPVAAQAGVVDALRPGAVVDATGERRALPGGEPVEEGDALVVATSGTTGRPRGAVLTHEAVRASALASSARLGVDPSRDRWLACLPLAHVGGLSVVTRSLVTGTPFDVHPHFDPRRVEDAARNGATLVSLVPAALAKLGRLDATLFRTIVLGGSRFEDPRPPNVVTTYGMTETASGVVYDGVPLDGVEVRVDESGEIHLRGPMLLRAYRDAGGTRSPFGAAGWLATGDAGRLLGDGRLEVEGRIAEVIVTGGEKVWPAAVEAVLATHPRVAEVAVAGRPDRTWGARVVAWVVPRAAGPATEGATCQAEPPALEELRDLVGERLAPWARPSELVIVDALPRTSIGKVRRRALR